MVGTDKILGKLRKLMDLKSSAEELGNIGEANAAAGGISRLLLEYNLSEKDIPEREKIDNPIMMEEIPVFSNGCKGKWYEQLICVITENNLGQMLVTRKRGKNGRYKKFGFKIVARKQNVEIILYLISMLSNKFLNISENKYKEYRHDTLFRGNGNPITKAVFKKSFLLGCSSGLEQYYNEKLNTLEVEINSLIISNTNEINDFLKDIKIHPGRAGRISGDSVSAAVKKMGFDVGKEVEMEEGINVHGGGERRYLG
jgi:hypothetical protein